MAFLGGKVKVLILNPDLTFIEKKVTSEGTELNVDKDYKPTFSMGLSVFKELVPTWKQVLYGKKPRHLTILLDGAMKCFELKPKVGRGGGQQIEPNYWTKKEREKFIAKVVAKRKAEQKMISKTEFYVLALIGGIILVLQIINLLKVPIRI